MPRLLYGWFCTPELLPVWKISIPTCTQILIDNLGLAFGKEAGKYFGKILSEKFMKSKDDEKKDFAIVVRNDTDHDLRRIKSVGSNGIWPLGDIAKNSTVEAMISQEELVIATYYRGVEARPGVQGIALAAAWSGNKQKLMGINLFPGKNAEYALKNLKTGVLDVFEKNGNRGLIKEIEGRYVYDFVICTLGYDLVAVESSQMNANRKAVALLKREIGQQPKFTFVVDNQSGYDIFPVGDPGKWPLAGHVIRNGECVAASLDTYFMSSVVEYSTDSDKRISLLGSWPMFGRRKIGIYKGMSAAQAWRAAYGASISAHSDGSGNLAELSTKDGCLVYDYSITSI